MNDYTLEDLRATMRRCAGEDDGVDLAGDIADRSFDELGYDSLALLETLSVIARETGVTIPDEMLGELTTPARLLAEVNRDRAAAV